VKKTPTRLPRYWALRVPPVPAILFIMKLRGIRLLLPALAPLGVATAVSSAYEPAPFSHYQPILERMPFGAPPPAFPAGPSADDLAALKTAEQEKAEQQQIAKMLSFSALNITPKGTIAVGFTDRSVNPPQSHYLEVGASAQGWTVVAADHDEEWAQFEKDDVTVTMHLFRGLIDGPPAGDAASATNAPAVATPPTAVARTTPPTAATTIPGIVRVSRSGVATPPDGEPDTPAPALSYLERRRRQVEQQEAAKEAADQARLANLEALARKIAQDELGKREQETANALEELRMQQELFQARQQEEEAAAKAEAEAEALAAQQQAQEEDPAPEPEQE